MSATYVFGAADSMSGSRRALYEAALRSDGIQGFHHGPPFIQKRCYDEIDLAGGALYSLHQTGTIGFSHFWAVRG